MTYSVIWKSQAKRDLACLDGATRIRILRAVINLETNPRPLGSKKMHGPSESWRIRSGDYRILYTIEDDRLVVLVIKIGHRREVYR
ncbi:MAG: type II toxin-antitoxin system RelE/ParE family toxin [Magnetococcales bacterium]|nr:type II toxin-antitoxin system RelE/ParE family toxin [Magnetococcales bacterium]